MINATLHHFIDRALAKAQITAGDVKVLRRDVLPDGILSRAVADALLHLDRSVETEESWAGFLTAAIVDYAVWGSRPTGVVDAETANWLLTALTCGEPTVTGLRIAAEIAAEAQVIDPALLLFAWRRTGPKTTMAA